MVLHAALLTKLQTVLTEPDEKDPRSTYDNLDILIALVNNAKNLLARVPTKWPFWLFYTHILSCRYYELLEFGKTSAGKPSAAELYTKLESLGALKILPSVLASSAAKEQLTKQFYIWFSQGMLPSSPLRHTLELNGSLGVALNCDIKDPQNGDKLLAESLHLELIPVDDDLFQLLLQLGYSSLWHSRVNGKYCIAVGLGSSINERCNDENIGLGFSSVSDHRAYIKIIAKRKQSFTKGSKLWLRYSSNLDSQVDPDECFCPDCPGMSKVNAMDLTDDSDDASMST